MYILGVHTGSHDASACLFRDFELVAAVSLERLTRVKNAGVSVEKPLPDRAIDEVLSIGGIGRGDVDVVAASRAWFDYQDYRLSGLAALEQSWWAARGRRRLRLLDHMMRKEGAKRADDVFRADAFLARAGFAKARLHFYNHHLAHGLAACFYSEFDAALIHTADGTGDGVAYSARIGRREGIELLFGGDDEGIVPRKEANSIGLMYAGFTRALGFTPNRHEGKLVGLAAHGAPVAASRVLECFEVDETGRIHAKFRKNRDISDMASEICRGLSPGDAAASIQAATEELMRRSVEIALRRSGLKALAVSGGVYANVRMNRHLLETTAAEAIFVFPAMGDDGLPVGGGLDYLLQHHGAKVWSANRRKLTSMLLGRDHAADAEALARDYPQLTLSPLRDAEEVVAAAVDALVAGKAVGLHEGRMEFGPRALGARSILASPARRDINDSLNARLSRSDFMPFAPVALAEYAGEPFDIRPGAAHSERFMTITCDVKPHWRDRIPAVTHLDGSARPQLVDAEPRTLYRRILELWRERTGVPVLVNTSFNVHEEPIVDTPSQALDALAADRVDMLIVGGRIFER